MSEVQIPEIEAPKPRKFIKQPDVQQRNKLVAKLNDEIKTIEASIDAVTKQIELTSISKEDIAKRQDLAAELRKIIASQEDTKKQRNHINEQVRLLDQSIKKKVAEITAKTSKYNFKTTEDIDKKIKKLESDIESGSLMLVEEKKALKEITSLNKLKKDFAGIAQVQKSIDADKEKIAELKSKLAGITNKEIQAKFEEVTKNLNEISNKNQDIQKKRDQLFDKKRALNNSKHEALKQIREIRDQFDRKFKKFQAEIANERKKREEEEKAYNLSLERKDILKEIEELEASAHSFTNEAVEQIKSTIRLLKPNYVFEDEKNALDEIDSSSTDKADTKETELKLPEGAELIKKEEETFFAGTGGKSKKGKKGKKQNKGVDRNIISSLTLIGISPLPKDESEFEEVVEKLKVKLEEEKKAAEESKKKATEAINKQIAELKEKAADLGKQILEELSKEKERKEAKEAEKVTEGEEKEEEEEKKEEEEEAN
ncbi:hypothetical protein CANINC_004516 [Pichia inconspicua]|uniref:Nuclear segregation protein BFR1 n=1 Tax=Pichia inconspicua TaxID=52247 RepID=A0A4T0WVN1_9ASCO|nr:hypothetical protein CANINC_004516 [[Candida] inconspicua]